MGEHILKDQSRKLTSGFKPVREALKTAATDEEEATCQESQISYYFPPVRRLNSRMLPSLLLFNKTPQNFVA